MDRWICKNAVVTGASAGIGAAVCVALATAGINVVGLARRPALIDALQAKVTGKGLIKSVKCDLTRSDDVAAAFKWINENVGCVHIIVNNAGVFHRGHITDLGEEGLNDDQILATIGTNYTAAVLCTRHAIHSMKTHGLEAHIININSIAGHYVPFSPFFNVYPSTKYAISAFTAGLLNELSEHKTNKIKVTSLSPGLVHTQLASDAFQQTKQLPGLRPEDVADAILYLLSTPPAVNIDELTITSVTEKRL
ncbi:farnesol dehydrogenase-like isoform X2 [Trichoplusia ni]|uniref:Farnesol dehydrogenase-like isoform X2 n=1 Tax=Trichoplusia ni TaxID=7111 RepID=A0A7E5WJY9_TRINI|nr:farnesol dehydrogenase-like isoform X2 [Trichoplusia ni]